MPPGAAPGKVRPMLRIMMLVALLFAAVAWVSRSRRMRIALWIMLGAIGLYGVLKLTGTIEAIAPSRSGVF